MKMRKTLLSLGLTLAMVMGMSAMAHATGTDTDAGSGTSGTTTYTDTKTANIKVKYTLEGQGTSPAETFTVTQASSKVADGDAKSAPELGAITGAAYTEGAAVATGAESSITIELPKYDTVGVYEYTLTPTVGNNAGVTYYDDAIKLVVTVINDGKVRVAAVHTEKAENDKKTDEIDYTYSAGDLKVSKEVTGNLGDKNKYFDVTVTLTGTKGKEYKALTVSGGSNTENSKTVTVGTPVTFKLKHGDTIDIQNIPYDVTYTVEEADYTKDNGGYDAAAYVCSDLGKEKKIDSKEETVKITNNKEQDVDTGIIMENLPYIVILAVLAVAALGFMASRRRRFE